MLFQILNDFRLKYIFVAPKKYSYPNPSTNKKWMNCEYNERTLILNVVIYYLLLLLSTFNPVTKYLSAG